MLQDPISKPPDVQMEISRGAGTDHSRRNKPNSASSEQVLKCPRCDSLNTKFCYYNNYSLTQPRHFCKNCRRYWTQGGSLRNVPIGGGCRKNKRVKQRTADPHLFGGLEDHSSFLQHGGAAGSLLSSSCFVGGAPNASMPGFGDLIPNNDSHLLSMAFSRLQESLRLSTSDQQSGAVPKQLSLMHMHPATLYDNASLDLSNGNYVKPEHHHMQIFNGSELGNSSSLFENPASNSAAHFPNSSASAAAGLVSLEQLTQFGIPGVDGFAAACHGSQLAADAQLKLVQQQERLALQLGGAASEHHMQNPTSCSSTGGSGAVADESGTRSHQYPERYINDFHHRHLALPDFEDQESPESMNSMMARRGHHAADRLVKGAMNMQGSSCTADKRPSLGMIESWQQMSTGHDQQQFGAGEAARKAATYHDGQPVTRATADQQAPITFWSPSPWSTNLQDVHTSALL